jgi:hypothetical protein
MLNSWSPGREFPEFVSPELCRTSELWIVPSNLHIVRDKDLRRPFPNRLWQLCTGQIKMNCHLAGFAAYYGVSNGGAPYAIGPNETLHVAQPHDLLDWAYSTHPFWNCHVPASRQHCNSCTEPVTAELSALSDTMLIFKSVYVKINYSTFSFCDQYPGSMARPVTWSGMLSNPWPVETGTGLTGIENSTVANQESMRDTILSDASFGILLKLGISVNVDMPCF